MSRTNRGRPTLWRRLAIGMAAVLATVGIGMAGALPAQADVTSTEKAIVQLYQQFTVTAHYAYQDGSTSDPFQVKLGYSCTGAFISAQGDILTAGHCVDPDNVTVDDLQAEVKRELEAAGKGEDVAAAYAAATVGTKVHFDGVIAYQPKEVGGVLDAQGFQVQMVAFKSVDQGDYALLRLNNFSQATPYLKFADAEPTIQQHLTAIGFPGVVADTSDVGRQRVSYPDGKVISFPTQYGLPWVQVSIELQHGMSGGPVVDDNNDIVGTVSWGHSNASGDEAKYITTLRGLKDFLKSNGVEVESAPAQPQVTPGTAGQTDGPGVLPTTPPDSGSGFPVAWVIIGVLALLVVGVGTYVLTKRSGKNAPPPTPPAPPAAQ